MPHSLDAETAIPRMGRRRTQAQRRSTARAALIRAAADVVVESGVGAVTLARVGERAGYSRGMVSHHFGSKQGLLEALARDAQAGLAPDLEREPPGVERLLRLIEAYLLAMDGSPREWQPFLLLWADAVGGGDLAAVMLGRDTWFRAHIRADVAAGVANGTIRPDVNPDIVALRVVAELRGIGLQRLLGHDTPVMAGAARVITEAWRQGLGADRAAVSPP